MNQTKIEWVKNPDGTQGYTLNAKTGCLNHTPQGLCLGGMFPCYAFRMANERLKQRYLANTNVVFPDGGSRLPTRKEARIMVKDPFYPRFWAERLKEPYQIKKPVGIFLDDMSDWMGSYWPEEWTRQELQMIRDNPRHRIYTLTKQSQNLIKFPGGNITNTHQGYRKPQPLPDNCWVGVTATDTAMFVEAMDCLVQVEAKVKYLSLEPLLEWHIEPDILYGDFKAQQLDWLIIGAMTCSGGVSGTYPQLTPMPWGKRWTLQPKIEWVEEIVKAADKAGIPVFLKDNLLELVNYADKKTEFAFNKDGYYRQEMPEEWNL